MKNVDYKGISLFEMETCVAVAQYKSITKAAEALHISQPALSKKISQIEEQLGIILFIRGKNTTLRTTSAGQYVCDKWNGILSDFRTTFNSAMGLQECKSTEHVVLVTTPSAQTSSYILPIVNEFRKLYPGVELRVENYSIGEAKRRLCAGMADVVMVTPYLKEIFETDELEWKLVAHFPLSAGMLNTNPLAKKRFLTIKDLATQQFVMPQSSAYIKYITDICEKHGFTPRISYYSSFFHGIELCVSANNEVIITDRFFQAYYNDNLTYFDLPDTKSGILMTLRKHETNEYVDRFASVAVKRLKSLSIANPA